MKKNLIYREAFIIPAILVILMVIIHLMDLQGCYGIVPRYLHSIRGILLAPLFHSDWEHLFNNAIPILVLGFMVFSFYRRIAYLLIPLGWMLTGSLVWAFADLGILPSDTHVGCHIGASGIVYMLAAFVFFSGIFRKSLQLIAISLIVVFLYGSMLWGIFPEEVITYSMEQQHISWESHLSGAIVGTVFAFLWRNIGPKKRKKYYWQKTDEVMPEDEELWQRYIEKYPEEDVPDKKTRPPFKDMF